MHVINHKYQAQNAQTNTQKPTAKKMKLLAQN